MATTDLIVPRERIERAILLVRGHRVLLDSDLAELYGVTTLNLNKAVKRNRDRFPAFARAPNACVQRRSGAQEPYTYNSSLAFHLFSAELYINATSAAKPDTPTAAGGSGQYCLRGDSSVRFPQSQ